MKIAHIKCFAHTLNLAAQKALSVSSESLANVRKVVKYFRKSALAGESYSYPYYIRLISSRLLIQARPNNISCCFESVVTRLLSLPTNYCQYLN